MSFGAKVRSSGQPFSLLKTSAPRLPTLLFMPSTTIVRVRHVVVGELCAIIETTANRHTSPVVNAHELILSQMLLSRMPRSGGKAHVIATRTSLFITIKQ